ncbi:hypothetical protein QCA50_016682 [Cerrena zonata]|uniref:Uncharacterized protein n=1 Tax=Cerrena zonata TaxID=2478898 RepID=A0AAW0FGM8_9APHY
MPYVVTAEHNHEMSLDRHHAHQYRPQGPASQASMHSHSNSPHQSYIGASQTHPSSYLTSSASAPPSLSTPNSSNVASSSSSLLPSPSSLSLTAGAHWHHPSHATPSHSQQHLNGTSRQRPYDSGDHETSASSSYSTSWGQPRQQWAFADETYNDTFPPHSSSTSSNNAYYSTPSYSSSSSNSNLGALAQSSTSSSLSNAVGSFSYSNLSGSPSLPSSLASSTLPSSSSTPLSSHQERPKLEPASWNPHSQQQHSHSQSQYYPLTINSHIDLSMDECMSPLTPISPSFSVSSPPSRSSASTNTMRGTKIKQEDEDVEHTDGFVFEMPGPSPSHHPFVSPTHSMSSPNLLGNSRESLKRGRTASMSLGTCFWTRKCRTSVLFNECRSIEGDSGECGYEENDGCV